VFYLFKWFLPAFAASIEERCGGGGGQHPVYIKSHHALLYRRPTELVGLAISSPIPDRGVFYLFNWFQPAFAAPRRKKGGGSQHPLYSIYCSLTMLFCVMSRGRRGGETTTQPDELQPVAAGGAGTRLPLLPLPGRLHARGARHAPRPEGVARRGKYTVKKAKARFSRPPAGMSLTKLSLARNNLCARRSPCASTSRSRESR
jgi:hypothetical protein